MSRLFEESGFLAKADVIREKVLPLSKFKLFTDMDDPELVPEKMTKFIEEAENYLDEPISVLPLSVYREFKLTGNRSNYEKLFFQRRKMLFALSFAEYYENKGRFASKLCDVIWAILEETSWVIPAHAQVNPALPKAVVPPVYDEEALHGIDLFSSATAALLVTALHYNRGTLDSFSPIIAERMAYEIRKRTVKPYLNYNFHWTGEYGNKVNNWNTWVISNVLYVTAFLEDNEYDRASVVLRAMKHLDNYTSWIPEDGGCDEGPNYWGAAGGALFDCCEILYDMTGGYIDVFSSPHLRLIGEYEVKMNINGDRFVNFADSNARISPDGYQIWRFGRRTGSDMLESYGRMLTKRSPDEYPAYRRMYCALKDLMMSADMDAETTRAAKLVWFPNLKVFISRESEDTSKGMFIAMKGGSNGESHNHNDVGHFIIYHNGNPVIIDPGRGGYSGTTFGKLRYTNWNVQSHYHNLPAFDGIGEKQGQQYRSTREEFDEETGTVSIGLEEAYEQDAGVVSFTRTARLDGGEAVVKDDILLDTEREIDFRLMTHVEPKLVEEGKLALAEGRTLIYDKSLACEIEAFKPTNMNSEASWGTPLLYRIHLKLRSREYHGEMRFV